MLGNGNPRIRLFVEDARFAYGDIGNGLDAFHESARLHYAPALRFTARMPPRKLWFARLLGRHKRCCT